MLTTYAPQSFEALRSFFRQITGLYQLQEQQLTSFLEQQPVVVRSFLEQQGIKERVEEFNQHTSSILSFEKRFFQWFNPFLIMKYVHFSRDHYYPDVSVSKAAWWLAKTYLNHSAKEMMSMKDYLLLFRQWDRKRR